MKTITINGKEYVVRPTALTPILYKKLTGKDLLTHLNDKSINPDSRIESILKLFYVISIQAEHMDINEQFKLMEDETEYYKFINNLDSTVLYSEELLTQTVTVYTGSTQTVVESKN